MHSIGEANGDQSVLAAYAHQNVHLVLHDPMIMADEIELDLNSLQVEKRKGKDEI